MEIKKQPSKVTVTYDPYDYWLKKSDDDWKGDYMLCIKIDMSYAGKDPQEGAPQLYLSDKEAQVFRDAGFDEIL